VFTAKRKIQGSKSHHHDLRNSKIGWIVSGVPLSMRKKRKEKLQQNFRSKQDKTQLRRPIETKDGVMSLPHRADREAPELDHSKEQGGDVVRIDSIKEQAQENAPNQIFLDARDVKAEKQTSPRLSIARKSPH